MKTGIITFHFVHNQGAVLQCYALQTALKKLGHDASVIDYRPRYHAARYAARKNPFALASNNWKKHCDQTVLHKAYHAARGFARGIISCIKAPDQLREENFDRFVSKHLIQTECFSSLARLRKAAPKMDAYISGSDQLWNPDLLDGSMDPAYFLDFGGDEVKRITYAVSLKQGYNDQEKIAIKKMCERIDFLSTREHSETLDEVLDRSYHVCVDPTLLLDQEDYRPLESENSEKEPYIFVYGFETSDGICEAVKLISEELGLRVINGSPDKIKLGAGITTAENYAPDQFLSYIKNAEFVVTNSFHGTAFSIIYGKQFVTVPHSTRGKRMIELLHKLGLSGRLWGEESFSWKTPVDHDTAREKMAQLRAESLDYLKGSLKQ